MRFPTWTPLVVSSVTLLLPLFDTRAGGTEKGAGSKLSGSYSHHVSEMKGQRSRGAGNQRYFACSDSM
jgi:hypothetical protein